ncbi:MAG TPA: DciA family protein [Pyrinomonadaceae bacterium]|nr:DciA family protein [Pyrinomonadaceae bacterium]
MNQLIKSLPSILRAAGDSEEVAEAAAIAAWKHAAGDGLKDHAVPVKLENRTLTVSVADAIWQKQLHSMRGQLLFRVNTILGQPIVSAIEFVVDPKLALAQAEQQRPQEEPLDNEVPLELWSAANAIHDKKLRKSFLKTATLSLKRRASKE